MKHIIILILGIALLSFISSESIVAGESYSFDLGGVYSFYEVNGNSSYVDLNISQNGTIVNIELSRYSKPDNFTITFYGEKNEVIGSSSSGGTWKGNQRINIKNGYSQWLREGQSFKFQLDETHTLKFLGIKNNSAILELKSNPIIFEIKKGEVMNFDLNDDQFYDLQVSLIDTLNNRVKIFIKKINIPFQEDKGNGCVEDSCNLNNESNIQIPVVKKDKWYQTTFLKIFSLIVIIISAVLVYFISRKK